MQPTHNFKVGDQVIIKDPNSRFNGNAAQYEFNGSMGYIWCSSEQGEGGKDYPEGNPRFFFQVHPMFCEPKRLSEPVKSEPKFKLGDHVYSKLDNEDGTVTEINEVDGKYEYTIDITGLLGQRTVEIEHCREDDLTPRVKPSISPAQTLGDIIARIEQPVKVDMQPNDPKLGRKFDSDKTQFTLVPPLAYREVADVLTFGAKKYAKNNWKYVNNAIERYHDAAVRHIQQYAEGETLDSESGKHHLAHAICCLMFIIELQKESIKKRRM